MEAGATNSGSATSNEEAATNGGSATSNEEAATNGGSATSDEKTDRQPSLNSLVLMRKATTPTDISSINMKDWHQVVYEGVLLENNTQKFWVDKKLHKNCFLVLPKACEIDGGNEESCWSWITKEEKCIVDISVPKSKKLSFPFLIQGRFKTRALSLNTTYAVAFVVQLNETVFQFRSPKAKLELQLPDGTKQTNTKYLDLSPQYEWTGLHAGEFMMGPKNVGTIDFALHGELNLRKGGLILKGVLIHPKD